MISIEVIDAIPMLGKLAISLGLILLANRLLGNLPASVLLGTFTLGALTGHTLLAGLRIALERLWSVDNFLLIAVIFLVVWLSTQMSMAGIMRDMVETIRRRLGRRHAMAVLPAVIGFLPMPGGAIFSAPLVDSCDQTGATAPILKARANYWFRHVWEFWWPLYPGILLAMHLTGLEVWQVMLVGLPLSCATIAGGYIFLLRRIRHDIPEKVERAAAEPLYSLCRPIFTVIGGYTVLRLLLAAGQGRYPALADINRYLPMLFGILLAMLVLERWRPLPRSAWRAIIFSNKTLQLALIVAAVRAYGAFIEAPLPDGTAPITLMQLEMKNWGIPMVAMVMLLPFIAGLTTGLAVGFVGASFPVIISMLGPEPPLNLLMASAALAYASGHMGQMLSPVHVCLIVTNEHFHTDLYHSLRGLLGPAAMVIATALTLYYIMT
ncbi:MAG: DUF401 family protein [Kiritimatiellia bacterium]|nr:DUF401 family protein [Lentisphaerota bacterium]